MGKKVRRSCRRWVLSQCNDSSPGTVSSSMVHPDILGRILQSDFANQASVKALCLLKSVCKVWHQAVKATLTSSEWLAPFTQSADAFVAGSVVLPSMPTDADDIESYRAEFHDILGFFLDELQLHQWYEDVQHDGLAKINTLLAWMIRKKLRSCNTTLRRILFLVHDAMRVHEFVERIQVAGCAAALLLGELYMQFICLEPGKSPTLICCIRNLRNFSLNAGLMNDVVCIIDGFVKSGHAYEHSAVQAGVIELVMGVKAKHWECPALQSAARHFVQSVAATSSGDVYFGVGSQ